MKTMVVALALLCCTTASAEEDCKDERDRYRRAVEAFENAEMALEGYDDSSIAPVVPGQADEERKQLQDAKDTARSNVLKASKLEDDCLRKKACKKRKPGWSCTINYTRERCCLDQPEKKSQGSGKGP